MYDKILLTILLQKQRYRTCKPYTPSTFWKQPFRYRQQLSSTWNTRNINASSQMRHLPQEGTLNGVAKSRTLHPTQKKKKDKTRRHWHLFVIPSLLCMLCTWSKMPSREAGCLLRQTIHIDQRQSLEDNRSKSYNNWDNYRHVFHSRTPPVR